MVNENASLIKYEPPKCDECGRKIVVLSDLCAKCAADIELNGMKQANRPGTNPLPTWPKPPAPPNPPPAPAVAQGEPESEFSRGYNMGYSHATIVEVPKAQPAVAVNEQMLEALRMWLFCTESVSEISKSDCLQTISEHPGDHAAIATALAILASYSAIAAAEAAKGGV